jgi:hypothetical protein
MSIFKKIKLIGPKLAHSCGFRNFCMAFQLPISAWLSPSLAILAASQPALTQTAYAQNLPKPRLNTSAWLHAPMMPNGIAGMLAGLNFRRKFLVISANLNRSLIADLLVDWKQSRVSLVYLSLLYRSSVQVSKFNLFLFTVSTGVSRQVTNLKG